VKLHTEGLDNDLQVTNEELGQLEATQIATNDKLTKVEAVLLMWIKVLLRFSSVLMIST
jgi:hypothetical protein